MREFLEIPTAVSLIATILSFILHWILAYVVNQDAQRLYRMPNRLFLVGPIIWGLIALLSGVVGLAIYWLIHYSSVTNSSRQDSP